MGKDCCFLLLCVCFCSCVTSPPSDERPIISKEQPRVVPTISPTPAVFEKREPQVSSEKTPQPTPEAQPEPKATTAAADSEVISENSDVSWDSFLVITSGLRGVDEPEALPPRRPPIVETAQAVEPEEQEEVLYEDSFSIPGWETASPEDMGMDSDYIADMLQAMAKEHNFDSVIVSRKGVIVSEANFFPHTPFHRHMMDSATQGVIGLLVGIAIDKGYIKGEDQSIWDFFPDIDRESLSPEKREIKIKDLLHMGSGYKWPELDNGFTNRADWVREGSSLQFIFDREMQFEPGERFNLDSLGSHLLSAIITSATGRSTEEFARRYLFGPLLIDDYIWEKAQGINYGGFGLHLRPRDMAKIGILFLNKGIWEFNRIVSAEWIEASSKPEMRTSMGVEYGKHWWVGKNNRLFALGLWGQRIFIFLDQELVIVTTGLMTKSYDLFTPDVLVNRYILPSIKSDSPLKADNRGVKRLREIEEAVSLDSSAAQPVPSLPMKAGDISWLPYSLEDNFYGWKEITFYFEDKENTARIRIDDWEGIIGLDGVYRVSWTKMGGTDNYYEIFSRGKWIGENQFFIDIVSEIGDAYNIEITFEKDSIIIEGDNYYNERRPHEIKGRQF